MLRKGTKSLSSWILRVNLTASTGICKSFPIPTQNSIEIERAYYFPGFTCRIKRKEGNRYRGEATWNNTDLPPPSVCGIYRRRSWVWVGCLLWGRRIWGWPLESFNGTREGSGYYRGNAKSAGHGKWIAKTDDMKYHIWDSKEIGDFCLAMIWCRKISHASNLCFYRNSHIIVYNYRIPFRTL